MLGMVRSALDSPYEKKLMLKMDEIMADQNRVKEYIHEMVGEFSPYEFTMEKE